MLAHIVSPPNPGSPYAAQDRAKRRFIHKSHVAVPGVRDIGRVFVAVQNHELEVPFFF